MSGLCWEGHLDLMSSTFHRELFTLDMATLSNTYDSMCQPQQECVGAGEGKPIDSLDGEEGSGDEGEEEGEEGVAPAVVLPPAREHPREGGQATAIFKAQVGNPNEDDLQNWGHHSAAATVPDEVMQRIAGDDVSFVFTCEVAGMLPVAPPQPLQPIGNQQRGAAMVMSAGMKPGGTRGPAAFSGVSRRPGLPTGFPLSSGTHLSSTSFGAAPRRGQENAAPPPTAAGPTSDAEGSKPLVDRGSGPAAGAAYVPRRTTASSSSFKAPRTTVSSGGVNGPPPITGVTRPAPAPFVPQDARAETTLEPPKTSVLSDRAGGLMPMEDGAAKRPRMTAAPPPPEVEIMILSSDSDDEF